jgi:hypothetical protein
MPAAFNRSEQAVDDPGQLMIRALTMAAAVLSAMAVLGLALAAQHPEPEYRGRRLNYWLEELDGPRPAKERLLAIQVIHRMGKDAIPQLLVMLRAHDSLLKREAMDWAGMQERVRLPFVSADHLRWRARQGLLAVGMPDLPAAVPGLEQILFEGSEGGWIAAECLAASGKPGHAALERALASADPVVRLEAATALRNTRAFMPNRAPALSLGVAEEGACGPARVPASRSASSLPPQALSGWLSQRF